MDEFYQKESPPLPRSTNNHCEFYHASLISCSLPFKLIWDILPKCHSLHLILVENILPTIELPMNIHVSQGMIHHYQQQQQHIVALRGVVAENSRETKFNI
jgi:hypothetical protein